MSYLSLDEDVLLKVFKNTHVLNETPIKVELNNTSGGLGT